MNGTRILVTGLGALSCLGHGIHAHRLALIGGRSGITSVRAVEGGLPVGACAGQVDMPANPGQARVWQFLQFALGDAIADAGLAQAPDCPVFVGSAHGDLDGWLAARRGRAGANALWEPVFDNAPALANLQPPTIVSTACTASAVAVGLAFDALRSGEHEIVIAAGAESLTTFLHSGFDALRALSHERCRPFDRNRTGLVLGEGAAALVLETDAHARRRGATGLVELAGYGFAADAASLTAPDPAGVGAAHAMRAAIAQAGFSRPPGFINAHGTGTRLNDRMECVALRRVFGDAARELAITSTKPLTGHLCGAAGAMEVISAAISLQSGVVPGIDGFEHPEPEFAAWRFVRDALRLDRVDTAVSMNSGFGGTNTAIALRSVTRR